MARTRAAQAHADRQVEALRRVLASDPAAHALDCAALARRLYLRGVRAPRVRGI